MLTSFRVGLHWLLAVRCIEIWRQDEYRIFAFPVSWRLLRYYTTTLRGSILGAENGYF